MSNFRKTRCDFLRVARVALLLATLYSSFACTERESVNSRLAPSDAEVTQKGESGSQIQSDEIEKQIDGFVTDQLLGGITLGKLYEVDKLKATFGKYQEVTQEPAKIDYEGMKGDHLNKYKYRNFDLVFYVVENEREIFAYLEIHDGVSNPIGKIGDSMKTVEAKFGDRIKKWSDTDYTVSVTGRNYLSGVTLLASNGLLEKVRIDIGEI